MSAGMFRPALTAGVPDRRRLGPAMAGDYGRRGLNMGGRAMELEDKMGLGVIGAFILMLVIFLAASG
jgi:hypothetical protein